MRKPWRIAAIVLTTVTFLASGWFGNRLLAITGEDRETLRLYTEIVAAAHDNYGAEVSYEDLVQASIQGMIRLLDPHTSFLTARAYDTMRDRQQETFSGLGILVGQRNGRLTVITPIEGTPASRMGIRAGDVISKIEGESTETMSVDDAVVKLKGPKGTEVQIEIVRRGLPEPLELVVTRAEIPQTTVRYAYMMTPTVGYIALTDFNRGTGREVEQAIEALRGQGMTRLLFDLRANGGGLLDQAIEVSNLFLPPGEKIVETRGRTRDSFQDFYATDEGERTELPIIVLVSDGTASAAEIVSGAIQDHDVGLIIGTPTWGKGLVQTVYSLSYGNGLAVTTAKYYTPTGRLIQRDYSSWFDYANYSNQRRQVQQSNEAFYTDLGREVYGGGGITPDKVVEPENLTAFTSYLLARSAFFDFSVEEANRAPIDDADWRPDDLTRERFRRWLLDEEVVTTEQWREAMEAEESGQEEIDRYLAAEFLGTAFGLQARHRVLSHADAQVQAALAHFDEAESLLARRRNRQDEPTREAAIGSLGTP